MHEAAHATAVIDTNVVLDWLVFGSAHATELALHITSGRVRWLATTAMRRELEHVLTRENLRRWRPEADSALNKWDAWSHTVQSLPQSAPHGVRCTDPDDQKFIDLAIAMQASWLITRDRSLLKLARRARPLGVDVVTPCTWLTAIAGKT